MKARIIDTIPTDGTTVYICGRNEDGALEMLGDITLMEDGSAIVMNDWNGCMQFFDAHEDALRYARTRVCAEPVYATMC